jgi:hypothetical protein
VSTSDTPYVQLQSGLLRVFTTYNEKIEFSRRLADLLKNFVDSESGTPPGSILIDILDTTLGLAGVKIVGDGSSIVTNILNVGGNEQLQFSVGSIPAIKVTGLPVFVDQGQDDPLEGMIVPGPAGKDGKSIGGPPGRDGEDGEDGLSIPGPPGPPGISIVGPKGQDGEDGEDGLSIPGPKGDKGAKGDPSAPDFVKVDEDDLMAGPLFVGPVVTLDHKVSIDSAEGQPGYLADKLGTDGTVLLTENNYDGFLPTSISGLVLWTRADLGITLSGANVTRWADQSGLGNDFISTGLSVFPTVTAGSIGGQPALTFAGTASLLNTVTFLTANSPRTIIVVAKPSGSSSTQFGGMILETGVIGQTFYDVSLDARSSIFGAGNLSVWDNATAALTLPVANVPGVSLSTPVIYGQTYNGLQTAPPTLFINGHIVPPSGATPTPKNETGGIRVSALGNQARASLTSPFGDIAEVLIFNVVLSQLQLARIQQYLSFRYGIALSGISEYLEISLPRLGPGAGTINGITTDAEGRVLAITSGASAPKVPDENEDDLPSGPLVILPYTSGSGINISGNIISSTVVAPRNVIEPLAIMPDEDEVGNGPLITLPYVQGTGITISGNVISATGGAGTVTSVSALAPLFITGGASPTPTVTIQGAIVSGSTSTTAQNLGLLTTGLLKGTVSGAISTISTAIAGTDFQGVITWPAATDVLVSAGTSTPPVGDTNFTYNTTTHVLSLGGLVLGANGSASAPEYSFTNSTNSGMWWDASNTRLVLNVSGSGQLFIASGSTIVGSGVVALTANGDCTVERFSSTGALAILGAKSVMFGTAAMATSATGGFLSIPSMAGAPSGVPTPLQAGQLPIVIDSTNKTLRYYIGSVWNYLAQDTSSLATGLLKNTTGVNAWTIAAAGTDYQGVITWPSFGQVLVSAGTGNVPVGDTNFTYNTTTHTLVNSGPTFLGGTVQLSSITGPGFLKVDGSGNVSASTGPQSSSIHYSSFLTGALSSSPGYISVSSLTPDPDSSASPTIEYMVGVAATTTLLNVYVAASTAIGTGILNINLTRNGTIIGTVSLTSATSTGAKLTTGVISVAGGATTDTYGCNLTLPSGTFTSIASLLDVSVVVVM